MKRFLISLLLLAASPAFALDQASSPPKFPLAWGASAGAAYIRSIPSTSQIGITNCAASLPDGFPPLTFVPAAAGGCPPFGQDFNGILKQVSQGVQWQQAGGPIFYDSAFSTAIGGYPKGAILSSAVVLGNQWISTVDNNTTDPDSSGAANWVQLSTQILTGTPVQSLSTTIPTGYVSANGLTIGNASSNATNRANADTQFLFAFVWNSCSNTVCPIFTSGGIASTRGATPAADYAANKAIAVHNMNGAALMGADSQNGSTSTFLSGVPAVVGTRLLPNSILGENLHALTVGELATHTHGVTDAGHVHNLTSSGTGTGASKAFIEGGAPGILGGGGAFGPSNLLSIANAVTGITINNSGSNTAHNTVARSTIVYWNLKL
jgi:hypothetical protein